jgi:hypothetical protein
MSHPFICSMSLGTMSSGEIARLSFPFIALYVPALTPQIHCSDTTLEFPENIMFVSSCHVNTGIAHDQSKKSSRCNSRGIIFIQTVQYQGKDGTLINPCHYYSWHEHFALYQDFLSVRKYAITLMTLVKNSNSDYLYCDMYTHCQATIR